MCQISVVMSICDAGDYVTESIESVLKQSLSDFELIILNNGSVDNIRLIISSYDDKRIRLIDNEIQDHVQLLNSGIKAAAGKYIALHNSDSIMHIDRLKLQYSIMEEFPEITVCSSWETVFGEKLPRKFIEQKVSGLIEMPLIQLLSDDIIINLTYTIRRSFIIEHNLLFENCDDAEEYKFWVETAKLNGGFYIDSQPLVYRKFNDSTISRNRRLKEIQSISAIKKEILTFLCKKYDEKYPGVNDLHTAYYKLLNHKLVTEEDIFTLFHSLFVKNKNKLL